MINLRKMIAEYVIDNITEEDIREAIQEKLDSIDLKEALSESHRLEDTIYSELDNAVDEAVDAWL